jgi:hypothetical protein
MKIELTDDAPQELVDEIERICHRQDVHKADDGWWYSANLKFPGEMMGLVYTFIRRINGSLNYLKSWKYLRVDTHNRSDWIAEDCLLHAKKCGSNGRLQTI